MKVFVSWSESLSHAVAQSFAAWLPTVIQECRTPFVSSDLAKGEAWFQAISAELADSKIGVAFITNDNRESPWLHFESGAMLTTLRKQSICPVVVDLAKTDYTGPLKNLQLTDLSDRADFFKLIATINEACDYPLEAVVLRETFDLRWPALEEQIDTARKASETPEAPKTQRTPDEKIDELLGLVREMRAAEPRRGAADAKLTLAEVNRRMVAVDDAERDWTPSKIKLFMDDNGDIVSDAGTKEELGILVDIKSDGKGSPWVQIRRDDGVLLARKMNEVVVTPF